MNVWPLKFRELPSGGLVFADDSGGFFIADPGFLERYVHDELTSDDLSFLAVGGHAFRDEADLAYTAFAYRWAARQATPRELSYVILVPTLRCNLSCGYCQVSRAPEKAHGFDWTEQTLSDVLRFLDAIEADDVKIEFQGGEPLLRLDLLKRVRAFCRVRFRRAEFVVCTNLQRVDHEAWRFLDAADTFVSTSLDGDATTHQRQRTQTPELTSAFFGNLDEAIRRLGPGKVSALPTIDVERPPDIDALIENFESRGVRSISLRPINHQGFARRGRLPNSTLRAWNAFHRAFVERLIERNRGTDAVIEEHYFSQCLKRVLRAGVENYVDLRNPNAFAADYIVIDHDGSLYPTDEARMLSRIGRIDLSIGNVISGVDATKVATLNAASLNNFDPDCIHCAYQPFCGTDVVDDMSRYGRVDVPRPSTWFCQRHTSLFDHLFELLYRDDAATRHSLSRWAGLETWPTGIVEMHR